MKYLIITITCISTCYGQFGFDDPKATISFSYPLGAYTFMPRIGNGSDWGFYMGHTSYGKNPEHDSGFEVKESYPLVWDTISRQASFTMGTMYNVWKPLHVYAGIGINNRKIAQRYDDGPGYIDIAVKERPLTLDLGAQLVAWRFAFGVHYNTSMRRFIWNGGWCIKLNE